MISLTELNSHGYPTTPEIDKNLAELLARLNQVREAYGIPMTVTSGLRDLAQQMAVNPKAPQSKHLTGQAADILDMDRKLRAWVEAHMDLMAEIGFWFEDFDHTPGWVHFQIVPPKSGKRVFLP